MLRVLRVVTGLVLAVVALSSCTEISDSPEDCDFDYHASLNALDAQSGEVLEKVDSGWPNDHPLLHVGNHLLSVEQAESTEVTAWTQELARDWSVALPKNTYVNSFQLHGDFLVVTGETSLSIISVPDGELLWTKTFQWDEEWGGVKTPTVSDDRVFIPNKQQLSAFDLESGQELWTASFVSQPATGVVADGVVITGPEPISGLHEMGPLVGLDESTGDQLWESSDPPADSYRNSPLLVDGTPIDRVIRVGGTSNIDLVGLDPRSGTEIWRARYERKNVADQVESSDRWLMVPAGAGHIDVLSGVRGNVEQRLPIKRGLYFGEALGLGQSYVLTGGERGRIDVYAVDQAARETWKREVGGDFFARLSLGTSEIFVTLMDPQARTKSKLLVLEQGSGKTRWRSDFQEGYLAPPIRVDDRVFVLSSDPELGCM